MLPIPSCSCWSPHPFEGLKLCIQNLKQAFLSEVLQEDGLQRGDWNIALETLISSERTANTETLWYLSTENIKQFLLFHIFRRRNAMAMWRRDWGSWRPNWRRRTRSCSGWGRGDICCHHTRPTPYSFTAFESLNMCTFVKCFSVCLGTTARENEWGAQ